MYCRNCGAANNDNAYKCTRCGEALERGTAPLPPGQTIPNYLVQSILVTLFCCLPLGIAAIVFAAQVNSKVAAGDIRGAMEASRKARTFCWWSLGATVGLTLLYFLLVAVASTAGRLR